MWRQSRDAASECGARQCVQVVEVNDAVAWHLVVGDGQFQFGYQAPTGTGQCGDDDRADPVHNGISGEDEYWPVAARGGGKPQLTAPHRPSLPSPPPAPNRRSP